MPTGDLPNQLIDAVWRGHRRWSNAADVCKQGLERWRGVALGCAVVGAALATLATQLGLHTWYGRSLSALAAVTLAASPVIRSTLLTPERLQVWTRARSASEALKEMTYLYLTRAAPYDAIDRDQVLREKSDDVLTAVRDIDRYTLGQAEEDRPIPRLNALDDYLVGRLKSQINEYYRPQAEKQHRRLTLFRNIESGLLALAAGLSALAAATGASRMGVWVPVIATIGAAVTAHIAAARYGHLALTYLATVRELESLASRWPASAAQSPTAARDLIVQCETVISRENESWLAAWTRTP